MPFFVSALSRVSRRNSGPSVCPAAAIHSSNSALGRIRGPSGMAIVAPTRCWSVLDLTIRISRPLGTAADERVRSFETLVVIGQVKEMSPIPVAWDA